MICYTKMPKLKEGSVTLAELKKEAAGLQIKGRSKMNKKELMEAIKKAKEDEKEITKDAPKSTALRRAKDAAAKGETMIKVPKVKRQDSPTRIDKAKMEELKKSGRSKPGRPKYRSKTPDTRRGAKISPV